MRKGTECVYLFVYIHAGNYRCQGGTNMITVIGKLKAAAAAAAVKTFKDSLNKRRWEDSDDVLSLLSSKNHWFLLWETTRQLPNLNLSTCWD